MSTTITANVSRMFDTIDPYDVSNSVANLGESAGRITWHNAQRIAFYAADWLIDTKLMDACEAMQDWAVSTGAWERAEVMQWSPVECMALFVQNIASELRDYLGSDVGDLSECVDKYEATDWGTQPCYPTGHYFTSSDGCEVLVQYYTGC